MQCLSRKKDEKFSQFFVLFLSVSVILFNSALSQTPFMLTIFGVTNTIRFIISDEYRVAADLFDVFPRNRNTFLQRENRKIFVLRWKKDANYPTARRIKLDVVDKPHPFSCNDVDDFLVA